MNQLLEIGRRVYETLGDGDADGFAGLLHPDVVLEVPGRHPAAGTYRGIDGVFDFLGTTRALATEDVELLDVLAGDRHVAALCTVRASRHGRAPLTNRTVHVFEVDDDGRVASIRFHNADQDLVDAFWG